MAILLKKILHLKEDGTIKNISDALSSDSGNGLDIKNNVLTLNLKNPLKSYSVMQVTDTINTALPLGQHTTLNSAGSLIFDFEEGDQIKVYLKYSSDGNEKNSADWSLTDAENVPSDDYLLGVYYIKEFKVNNSQDKNIIKIICADKTYIIFNKILAKTFNKSNSLTVPEMIQQIVLQSSQSINESQKNVFRFDYNGSHTYWDIFAGLDDENATLIDGEGVESSVTGAIQKLRSDSTAFPSGKTITKVWKPVYEWLNDLSQISYTNTAAELSSNNLVYKRPFIMWIDELGIFHWVEPSQVITQDVIVGVNNDVIGVNLTKAVFDTKNMLIFNAGTDMNGHGILHYVLDTTSNVKGLKMQYIPFLKISENLIQRDYDEYTLAGDRVDSGEPFPKYPSAYGGGLTTSWSGNLDIDNDSIPVATDDSSYNSTLRDASKKEGVDRASALLKGLASARWKGSIEIKGAKWTPGTFITFTDTLNGIYKEKIRVIDVKHNIGKTGWFTTLELEQDSLPFGG